MPTDALSLPGPEGPVFALNDAWMQKGVLASRQGRRGRIMLPMHRRAEGVQRMVNFVQPGSYIRPHRHPLPGRIECVAVIQGCMGLFEFSPEGEILRGWRLEAGMAGACLADIDAGVWHTMVALAPDSVMLEIKAGPYDPSTDKEFGAWSPAEDSPAAADYLRRLESFFDRERQDADR
ncbi:MAG: WbuC family cupin fold metalloprotein [Candidatus Methylacidiphilales bacterium]|nr:WbuC family cupin fold metalloprotein [Candidatus Methylacidiphilales bacterium]